MYPKSESSSASGDVRTRWASGGSRAALGLAAFLGSCGGDEGDGSPPVEATLPAAASQPGVEAVSRLCRDCHPEIYETWLESQHGLANRLAGPRRDAPFFAGQTLRTGVEDWLFRKEDGELQIVNNGKVHRPDMAIGESPLVQYLIPFKGGRWQTTSAAWDTGKKKWFDMLAGDDRTSIDWGHWTGRGMTWNVQCAWCHMTGFRKNYDEETDSYASEWNEMGIGCTMCHGGVESSPHPETGCLIDLEGHRRLGQGQILDGCATCHSRRGEFDEEFRIGDVYGDHYQLALASAPHLYYPDGQIRDEVYVYLSLRMSTMGHAGVTCLDCHDAHQAEVKFPLGTNAVCIQCHATGTNGRIEGAPVVDLATHSRHEPGSTGSLCVECHMTHTVYMGNDPRRDHGFHIPDPLLTGELGIPNACNKCHEHEKESVEWAIKAADDWWKEKMNRPERARTRAVARAFEGERDALEPLLEVYSVEEKPFWRANLLQIMQPWASDARVRDLARVAARHDEPALRAAATALLEYSPGNEDLLAAAATDPVKEVRLAAAWAMRRELDTGSPLGKELAATIAHGSDQPLGAHRRGRLAADRGDLREAERWIRRAVEYDRTSAGGREAYAVLLGEMNRPREALEQLRAAARLNPDNARYPYLMALTQAELRREREAEKLLRRTLEMDPRYDRAWYNLGLLFAGQDRLEEAVEAIRKAEAANPRSPEYPFARATVHSRMGEPANAAQAARRALEIQPGFPPALQLLHRLRIPSP